jgi:maleate isomerase
MDFARAVPSFVTIHVARAYLAETTIEAERRMLRDYLPQAAVDLASAFPDVVVFSCTSAAALLGDSGEVSLINDLSRQVQSPVVSTNAAVASALGRQRGTRIALLTPYVDEVNRVISSTLCERGLTVMKLVGMGITDNFAIAGVTPDEIVRLAISNFDPATFDILFISCTNFRAMEVREELEHELGRPVVTSNSAAIAAAIEMLERNAP